MTEEESTPPILTQQDMARIWQAAMTDWLTDRQNGYRRTTEE